MMNNRRHRLLKLLSDIEQQIAEAQAILAEGPSDDTLHEKAATQLSELRGLLVDVQQKLDRGKA